jgi:histidinol-phosphatase
VTNGSGDQRHQIVARWNHAVAWAEAAGALTLEYFGRAALSVDRKQDGSPVTIADRRAEQWLREQIECTYPDDGIVGEEFGEKEGSSGYRWILDPIDGTKSFIFGVPLYATLVGIEYRGESVAGVIHCPALKETVYAALGEGCFYQNATGTQRAAVSQRELANGLFVTSQVDSFDRRGARDVFDTLAARAYVTRTWGDAYGYLLVATGRAELMIDPVMHIWDAAAILPILEAAGGCFTDWQGRRTTSAGEGIGSNGRVHPEVIRITERFARRAG